ncbi:MAG: GNAT family N-acetyltransferase [Acidobacteriia bacterium]|nr:GNAT family N-acetyltransferase [Terriglobia bacterium]
MPIPILLNSSPIPVTQPLRVRTEVGYIEGWYVAESHRHKGIGRKLLVVAEDWARSQGYVEMASEPRKAALTRFWVLLRT